MLTNFIVHGERTFVALRKAGRAGARAERRPVYHAVTPHCRMALCAVEPGAWLEWAEPLLTGHVSGVLATTGTASGVSTPCMNSASDMSANSGVLLQENPMSDQVPMDALRKLALDVVADATWSDGHREKQAAATIPAGLVERLCRLAGFKSIEEVERTIKDGS